MSLSGREATLRKRLRDDFPYFAEKCLQIRTKKAVVIDGERLKIAPFILNRAQRHVHAELEAQKKTAGRVRALILKGRQQGMSTYIGARFFHRTIHSKGVKTFIVAHTDDATNNLFNMTKRYFEHLPELVRPHTSYSNRRELVFDKLDSAYGLGTAGTGAVGRSDTIDFMHSSETAFWGNTDELKTGIMQAAEGAEEIIFESTANGLGNMFHQMWQDAEAGLGEYVAIFVPWFWQDEYRTKLPEGEFNLTDEEKWLKEAYGLDNEQILWRRNKVIFLKDPLLFKQEYPCTSSEAFQTTGVDSFIKPDCVLLARHNKDVPKSGAHVVGLDPARGGDRTSIVHRQGRVIWGLKSFKTPDTTTILGHVKELMNGKSNPVDMLFIDIGGLGGPLYDSLKSMDFRDRITAVNFGDQKCFNKERYKNKRAEMWGDVRDWLESTIPVKVPDSDSLQADLCSPGYKYDHMQRILLESKDEMKANGRRSPDEGDAVALTFAAPVSREVEDFTDASSYDSGFMSFSV